VLPPTASSLGPSSLGERAHETHDTPHNLEGLTLDVTILRICSFKPNLAALAPEELDRSRTVAADVRDHGLAAAGVRPTLDESEVASAHVGLHAIAIDPQRELRALGQDSIQDDVILDVLHGLDRDPGPDLPKDWKSNLTREVLGGHNLEPARCPAVRTPEHAFDHQRLDLLLETADGDPKVRGDLPVGG
jgi:hypothetical protein